MYILILFAYLLGSINSAILVSRIMHLPCPTQSGSKNPGATNVMRLGGKKAALFTLIGDVLKGIIPVFLGHLLHFNDPTLCWIGLAAVIGHIFPIFFFFKGGKGVATALGSLFAIHPILGLFTLGSWLILFLMSQISSLSSLLSLLFMPFFAYFLLGTTSLPPLILMTLLIVFRHHQNIKKLLSGTESKMSRKK